MSAAHAPVPLPHGGGGGGGLAAAADGGAGGDDDGNDPSRLKRTHTIDADPVFSEEEEEEEEEEKDGLDIPPDQLPPLDILRPTPHLSGWRRDAAPALAPHQCHVCGRTFRSAKSLHGHMRSHPARKWRGAVPPSMRPGFEQEAADSLLLLSGAGVAQQRKYVCDGCQQEFDTRQALGGHRASHRNRKGCYARAQEVRRGGSKRKERYPGRSGGETSWAEEHADEEEGEEGAAEAPTASGGAVEVTSGSSKRRRRERRVDLNVPPVSPSDTGSASSSSAGNSAP
ncbi:hypothetical protein OPV22_007998 [Ensete ventricosum]|uniref:C2H2-type domain-containing protein n=1 Tax=Ensete ventricosum TaxID=4639 RepID=A0AAV8R5M7_ENSVE|nr:hypothetical protein OPV22_007998 [Ensete ventricosum]